MMASSSSYAETPAATICLAFPTPPESSLGTPHHFVLNNILQYLCKCAQTHKSPISKKMNLLNIAINPTLYGHYSGSKAYPNADYPFPTKVANVPNYSGSTDTNDGTNVKVTHRKALKQCNDVINMNPPSLALSSTLSWLPSNNTTSRSGWKTPTLFFARCLPGLWRSMAAHLRTTVKAIALSWP
jgi:hypothetical protein